MDRFTKSDLRNGYVCVTTNNEAYITLLDMGILVGKENTLKLDDYDENFIFIGSRIYLDNSKMSDINQIYRPLEKQHCSFGPYWFKKGRLVFNREEKIKITIEEIAKWKDVLPEQVEIIND